MSSTPALRFLAAIGIEVTLHPYAYDPKAEGTGLQAAQAMGIDPAVMLKTLMVEVDGKPACCVIPSDKQLAMKKVASVFGGKVAAMMPAPKAEKLTGYHVGASLPSARSASSPRYSRRRLALRLASGSTPDSVACCCRFHLRPH